MGVTTAIKKHKQFNLYFKQYENCVWIKLTQIEGVETLLFVLKPAEQIVAGLLQKDVVITLICAVWVIIIAQVSQPVHLTRKDKH